MQFESLIQILKNGKNIMYLLVALSICIYSTTSIMYDLKNIYGYKRELYSLFLFFDNKIHPNFFTKFGPIPTNYKNTCYINDNNKDAKIMELTLKDFHVASAYRPYQVAGQTNDICSYSSIKKVIEKGARFHYLDIWSSNPINIYDTLAYPIVRNKTLMGGGIGYSLKFDKVCEIYKTHSWAGTNYPLILYLNLENTVASNRFVQNKIAQILWSNFNGKFAGAEYSFSRKNIGDIPIKKTFNNIIIITNIYPVEGNLQELVNGVISNTIQNSGRLDILSVKDIAYDTNKKGEKVPIINTPVNTEVIVNSNKSKLGIYIPGDDAKTIFNVIDPTVDLIQIPSDEPHNKLGYNFVAINYQKPGIERDNYIDFFKDSSFKVKDDSLRTIPCPKPVIISQNIKASYAPRSINKYNGYFQHSF